MNIIDTDRKKIFFLIVAGIIVLVPMYFLTPFPARDVALRYAPMADAFARGDFAYAFHPRIPFLHPFLGGCVAYFTNLDGYTAVRVVSSLFYLVTVLPLWGIFRRIFSANIAFGACLLYLLCPDLLMLAESGLRDPLKGFFVAFAVYSLIRIRRDRKNFTPYLLLATAAAIMCSTRSECVLIAFVMLIAMFGFDIFRSAKCFAFPIRSIAASAIFMIFMIPACLVSYHTIGYFVSDFRFAVIYEKIEEKYNIDIKNHDALFERANHSCIIKPSEAAPEITVPSGTDAEQTANAMSASATLANIEVQKTDDVKNVSPSPEALLVAPVVGVTATGTNLPFIIEKYDFAHDDDSDGIASFVWGIFKGMDYVTFFPVLIMIFIRLFKRRWDTDQTILAAVFYGHTILVAGQIFLASQELYISSRYLITVAPLSFGWAIEFFLLCWEKLKDISGKIFNRATGWILIIAAIFIQLLGEYDSIRRHLLSKNEKREYNTFSELRDTIKNTYKGESTFKCDAFIESVYYSNKRPLVIMPGTLKEAGAIYEANGTSMPENIYSELARHIPEADFYIAPAAPQKGNYTHLKTIGKGRHAISLYVRDDIIADK